VRLLTQSESKEEFAANSKELYHHENRCFYNDPDVCNRIKNRIAAVAEKYVIWGHRFFALNVIQTDQRKEHKIFI